MILKEEYTLSRLIREMRKWQGLL